MSLVDVNSASLREGSEIWASLPWETEKAAEQWLRHANYLELRNVSCDYHKGVLTLRGRVPSYYLKQLAQALLEGLEGVLELNNQLDVVMPCNLRQSDLHLRNLAGPTPRRFL